VFADFKQKLSEGSRQARFAFLGNIQPDLQREVRAQVAGAELVALDTMNYWIDTVPDAVWEAVRGVHVVIINDAEARQLAGEPNLIKAARKILAAGPRALVIKRGEYGAALFTPDTYFAIPAYPLESVFDPTGAGDTFAGGFMGYLASHDQIDEAAMRRAMIFGSVMASFNVEEFGTERTQRLTHAEINERFRTFKRMTHFEEIPFERAGRGGRKQRREGVCAARLHDRPHAVLLQNVSDHLGLDRRADIVQRHKTRIAVIVDGVLRSQTFDQHRAIVRAFSDTRLIL
ncbi:MAG TPA: PfkB family carbohydrate kinase, partial [Pyrinomonadaceae bacterium]|nr:PfkB family carbohydrate kinase [Pyrinomonadaceae bacterium]